MLGEKAINSPPLVNLNLFLMKLQTYSHYAPFRICSTKAPDITAVNPLNKLAFFLTH